MRAEEKSNPEIRKDTAEIIGGSGRRKLSNLRGRDSEIKLSGNFGASSGKHWTSKIERRTLKNGAESSIFH